MQAKIEDISEGRRNRIHRKLKLWLDEKLIEAAAEGKTRRVHK